MNNEEQIFTDAGMLRKKAEELLKSKQKKTAKTFVETDTKKLLARTSGAPD